MQLALRVTTVGLMLLITARPSVAAGPAKTPGTAKPAPRVKVTISKETTVITSPLRPDGYPDYVAAMNLAARKGVTSENNAMVPLVRAFGPRAIRKEDRAEFFKMLGIEELPEEGRYYQKIHGDKPPAPGETDKLSEQQDAAAQRPWSAKEFPALAAWLQRNQRQVDLMADASRKPRFYAPMIGGNSLSVLLPMDMECREAGRALRCRAMLRLGEGKIDEAWQDLSACHRLGRLVAQGPTLIDSLVGFALERMACESDAALGRHPKATAAQFKRFEADLRALPPFSSIAEKLATSERYMYIDGVITTARQGLSTIAILSGGEQKKSPLEELTDAMADTVLDWDEVLRYGNPWYDRLAEIARTADRAERRAALARFEEDVKKLSAEVKKMKSPWLRMLAGKDPRRDVGQRLGQAMIALTMPALGTVLEHEDRTPMTLDVTRVALALGAYRAEHGQYPERLAALVPGYLPAVPKDLFGGGELLYRREGKGFVVYSVGPNGRDDGGQGRDLRTDDPASHDWDDIAVRVKGE